MTLPLRPSASPVSVLTVLLVLFVLYMTFYTKRHGLNQIPGPFLARYTDAWRVYQAWKHNHYSEFTNYQIELLGKYGDVVRIGPNHVLVLDPEAINTVLGFKERLEKGPGYQVFVLPGASRTALVGIRDEATHAKYRRPIANAFSLSSLRGYEPYIDSMIKNLTDILDQRAQDHIPINMSKYLHYWAFDVMSKLTFGEHFGFIEHGSDFNGMIKTQKGIFRYISTTNNMPVLDWMIKKNPILRLFAQPPTQFYQFASSIVRERINKADSELAMPKENKLHPDLLGSFIAQREKYPDIMTEIQLIHYAQTMLVAGANNSALAMDRTMHFLASFPEAQERLHEEIVRTRVDGIEGKEAEGPNALDLALRMQYLEAIVQESYRLFASPSDNLERVVSSAGLLLPNGVRLPPGVVACMNEHSVMQRKEVFGQDASDFNPDRWLPHSRETEAEFAQRRLRMDRSMLAFGAGSRACIGKNVVQLELYKVWPALMGNYKFESVGKPESHNVLCTVTKR